MYAIISTGGTQQRVETGTIFETDRLSGEPGDTITLEQNVLMLNDGGELKIGTPLVEGATVSLEIIEHFRGTKVIVFKMKRRKRCRRKHGHRQELTRVEVKDIKVP